MDLAAIFADSSCSLLAHSGVDIPKESYAEQLKDSDTALVSTYVPFRNGLFLSSAAAIALSLGCSVFYYGAHHDDCAGNAYPDCAFAFAEAMNEAIVQGTGGELHMEAPFVQWSKADIVKRVSSLTFLMSLRGPVTKVATSLVGPVQPALIVLVLLN